MVADPGVDGRGVLNGIVMLIVPLFGFLIVGPLGLALGLGAAVAFVKIGDELARLSKTVETLESETERLERRLSELEGTLSNDRKDGSKR